jgi:hypothetical protein
MTSEPTGHSRISIYLRDVTDAEIEALSERICDLLRDIGMGNQDRFRSIVLAEGWEWPAHDHEALIEELRMSGGAIYLPDAASE